MLTKAGRGKCDECGVFLSISVLETEKAHHELITPDSEFTAETCQEGKDDETS